MIKQKVITYEPVTIDRSELITLKEASKLLGLTLPGVIACINRGSLTEYIDEGSRWQNQGHRLVSRVEVQKLADARSS